MTNNHDRVVIRGLRDVAAAETKISFVNSNGTLYYLGYDIDDLVERVCYEEVVHLLLYSRLPNKKELEDLGFNPDRLARIEAAHAVQQQTVEQLLTGLRDARKRPDQGAAVGGQRFESVRAKGYERESARLDPHAVRNGGQTGW